ncbi:MAG TPA: hypothetical protein VMR97_08790 [Acidimicrobiales bacterium]|nr:hypothetical protein [Acidimicrobiales bacterium]
MTQFPGKAIVEPGLPEKVEMLNQLLDERAIPHAFGGALALAYYTEPRATADIDLNIFTAPSSYSEVAAALETLGVDRLAAPSEVERDGQGRLWWGRTPLDLFFAYDPFHEAMRERSRSVPFGAVEIPILAPEHLLVAKAHFDRRKDWLDIEQIMIASEGLDVTEVHRWLDHLVGPEDQRARRVTQLESDLIGD